VPADKGRSFLADEAVDAALPASHSYTPAPMY
jgi:hypothetical protein